jgi:hypothetical protein
MISAERRILRKLRALGPGREMTAAQLAERCGISPASVAPFITSIRKNWLRPGEIIPYAATGRGAKAAYRLVVDANKVEG